MSYSIYGGTNNRYNSQLLEIYNYMHVKLICLGWILAKGIGMGSVIGCWGREGMRSGLQLDRPFITLEWLSSVVFTLVSGD